MDDNKLELLIKIMKMTTAEPTIAAVAFAKANQLLAQEGWDWERLLRGKVKILADPFSGVAAPPQFTSSPPPKAPAPPTPPRQPQPPPSPAFGPAPRSFSAPPPPAQPRPSAAALRMVSVINGYNGACHECLGLANAGTSWAVKQPPSTRWQKYCPSCHNSLMDRNHLPRKSLAQAQAQPPKSKWKQKHNPKSLDDLANF